MMLAGNLLKTDTDHMRRCFKLALNGSGAVSPNPLVGAVIVKDARIIAEGWHKEYGGPHAEVEAFQNATESVQNATLYCNLEPCCHTKKQTPPCTPMIIEKGITRVVVANPDPNPEVSGQGIKQLEDAGIEVVSRVLEEEGRALNRFYFSDVLRHRPFITLKIAQTLDSKISLGFNQQTWITGEAAKEYVHQQRAVYDAVIVGANTVKSDDPQLTVRSFEGRNPKRIVLDGNLTIPGEAKLLNDREADTLIFVSSHVPETKISEIERDFVRVVRVDAPDNGWMALESILEMLHKLRITSLYVEGGQELFSQFISQQLFDELIILIHPVLFGNGVDSCVLNEKIPLKFHSMETLGEDVKLEYKKQNNNHR